MILFRYLTTKSCILRLMTGACWKLGFFSWREIKYTHLITWSVWETRMNLWKWQNCAARWYLEFQSSWILDLWLCPLPKKRLSLGCIVYTVTRELDSDCVRSDVWRLEACGSGSQPMQTSSLWLLASHAALGVVSSWERSPGALPTSSSHRVQHG